MRMIRKQIKSLKTLNLELLYGWLRLVTHLILQIIIIIVVLVLELSLLSNI